MCFLSVTLLSFVSKGSNLSSDVLNTFLEVFLVCSLLEPSMGHIL